MVQGTKMLAMRRVPLIIALLSTACATTEADKPSKDAEKDKAPVKAEREPDPPSTPEAAAEADPDKPPANVKVKGNLPVKTESELAAEAEARDECVSDCVDARKMEAKGADAIEVECQQQCMAEHPVEQVEVVPDGPL